MLKPNKQECVHMHVCAGKGGGMWQSSLKTDAKDRTDQRRVW